MKVLVTTIVALNPGDAAILQGTVVLLQRAFGPDVDVAAVDTKAAPAARLYPWMRFVPSLFGARKRGALGRRIAALGYEHRLRRFDAWRVRSAGLLMKSALSPLASLFASAHERSVIGEYLSADLVVASGGTYLVPAYNMDNAIRDYEFTLALGRPLAFMAQSMGPFIATPFRERLREVFSRARFVLVREPRSQQHLLEIGVPPERVTVVPDAAFALARPSALGEGASHASPRTPPSPLRVAISVREWKLFSNDADGRGEERYLAGVAGLVTWLVSTLGAQVTFLSSCQGIPDYWTDDAKTAHRAVSYLSSDVAARVTVDEAFRGPEQLLEALSQFDVVVATRMHVAILALCAGRTVLPIAYEFKTTELFASIGLGEFVTQIDECDGPTLVARAERLIGDWKVCSETRERGVAHLVSQLAVAESIIRR